MSATFPIAAVAALALAGTLSRRPGSRAIRAPSGLRMTYIDPGVLLYHGTSAEEDFDMPDGPAWFSTSRAVANRFSFWNDGSRHRIYTFRVKRKINGLLSIRSSADMQCLSAYLEDRGLDAVSPKEMSDSICELGFNGWHIPDNYGHGESDTMICDPSMWLEYKNMESL